MVSETTRVIVKGRLVLAVLLVLLSAQTGWTGTETPRPALPRVWVEIPPLPTSETTVKVPAGGDLQAAINRAQPGDVIALEAGARFTGNFTLPNKPGSEWIIIGTSVPDSNLPPPGTRITPAQAALMPKIVSPNGHPAIRTAPGAHHYRFIGVEVRPAEGVFLPNLVLLGFNEASEEQLPHHIIFDRCLLRGDPKKGARRGIAMNSRHTAVVDSHLADFKEVGGDSQAIAGWNGAGPFKIVNNYLEGAGENVMFGGADPVIRGLVPSDIEIRGNRFSKPLSWKIGDPAYEGTAWTVKNLFELKNARRVLIEGNLFEHNWAHAQTGFAILFTVRNQDGGASWSTVEDVTFSNNIVRRVGAGINILGRDNNHPSEQTKRIRIHNNLFEEVGGERWSGNGTLFQILEGTADVAIEDNSAGQTGNIIMAEGTPHSGFVFRGNRVPHNAYGISGTGTGPGTQTLQRYFPRGRVQNNAILADSRASKPIIGEGSGARKGPGVNLERLCAALAPAERATPPCAPRAGE